MRSYLLKRITLIKRTKSCIRCGNPIGKNHHKKETSLCRRCYLKPISTQPLSTATPLLTVTAPTESQPVLQSETE